MNFPMDNIVIHRGGARHFHLGGPLEGPVLQQGKLSMVCVGLQCSGMTSRGKFGGGTGGPGKIFGGQWPPLAPTLVIQHSYITIKCVNELTAGRIVKT